MSALHVRGADGLFKDIKTIRGLSAYQVAVKEGFKGTEQEWLDSLKGEKGQSDKSLGMTAAQVGQIAKIKAIGPDGVPTEWEPVDMGGGGEKWTLVEKKSIVMDNNYLEFKFPAAESVLLTWDGIVATEGYKDGGVFINFNDVAPYVTQFIFGKQVMGDARYPTRGFFVLEHLADDFFKAVGWLANSSKNAATQGDYVIAGEKDRHGQQNIVRIMFATSQWSTVNLRAGTVCCYVKR